MARKLPADRGRARHGALLLGESVGPRVPAGVAVVVAVTRERWEVKAVVGGPASEAYAP